MPSVSMITDQMKEEASGGELLDTAMRCLAMLDTRATADAGMPWTVVSTRESLTTGRGWSTSK